MCFLPRLDVHVVVIVVVVGSIGKLQNEYHALQEEALGIRQSMLVGWLVGGGSCIELYNAHIRIS